MLPGSSQSSPGKPTSRRVWTIAWGVSTLIALALVGRSYCSHLDDLGSYYGDEGNWIHFSERSFRLAFLERTADPRAWGRDFYNFGARNPILGKYLMGFSLWAHGFGAEEVGGPYHYAFRLSLEENKALGHVAPPAVVAAARLPVALSAVGVLGFMVLVGGRLDSWAAGAAAAALLAAHSLFFEMGRFAMTDMFEVCFAFLVLVVLLYWVERLPGPRLRFALATAALGIATGLALSTKLRATLALVAVAAVVGVLALRPPHGGAGARRLRAAGSLVAILGLSSGVIVALNPYLYAEPLAGLRHMYGMGSHLFGDPKIPMALPSWPAKIGALWHRSFVDPGLIPAAGDSWAARAVAVALVALGVLYLGQRAFREWRSGEHPLATSLLLWIGVSVAGVLVWTPFAWHRYYLYLYPSYALLFGFGAVGLAARLGRALVGRRLAPADR